MGLFTKTPNHEKISDMRIKWKAGVITTRKYHDYIEQNKRSLAKGDRTFRFF